MEKVIITHRTGPCDNQVEEFLSSKITEITVGGGAASPVQYVHYRDDLVSRMHARITHDADDTTQFVLIDGNEDGVASKNGTYVNQRKITGSVRIQPGDLVQFGPGGPEFEFDLDP